MKTTFFKLSSIIIASILGFSLFCFTPTTYADDKTSTDVCNNGNMPKAVKDAAGCNGTGDKLPGLIIGIINAVIAVSGIIAVIYVLIGGVNYMTSTGDPGKIEKAKKTILYACIGLAICALSFAIVNFAIVNIINGQSSTQETTEEDSDQRAYGHPSEN